MLTALLSSCFSTNSGFAPASRFTKVIALAFCLVSSFVAPAVFAAETPKAEVQKSVAMAKVNINTASAEDIAELLNDVGPKKAEAIVAYRQEFGPFKAVDDLMNVKGIGAATLEKNRDLISL